MMIQKTENYEVIVCGGGLAGFSAAVSAARHGAKTCVIQDRPYYFMRIMPMSCGRCPRWNHNSEKGKRRNEFNTGTAG